MPQTETIIIGGGPAGLAMSRALSLRGIAHVVLERGRVGQRWRNERWDSLKLLTTATQSTLPGLAHEGPADAFMPAVDFASYLDRYATTFAVPIETGTTVEAVIRVPGGYEVVTSAGRWQARSVVIATGASDVPHRPAMASHLAPSLLQLAPSDYQTPAPLPIGGVLVVGASSTGLQIAEEVHASGRPVTIAVGDHTRMVRRYRGRDIIDWMETVGLLDDPADQCANLKAARRQPSMQLIGDDRRRDLNLAGLAAQGVRLAGRLTGINGRMVRFAGDLMQTTSKSHARLIRTLQRIDEFMASRRIAAPPSEIDGIAPFIRNEPGTDCDLTAAGIRTVIWATGYRRRYPWLKVPVLDRDGEIVHHGGVTDAPGLYVLGLNFMRRRRSAFISGFGRDADDLAELVKARLGRLSIRAA